MAELKGVCVGAGYFSQFHYEAWSRLPQVDLVACCDLDTEKLDAVSQAYNIHRTYTDVETMLQKEKPDFIDIITPPATHLSLVKLALSNGVAVICQKPLAPSFGEAAEIATLVHANNVPFMVHENFRWMPWHREAQTLVQSGVIGDKLHSLYFRTRTGDGWGENAYLDRQPYFRTMPRLLIHETGIHYIDTLRFLAGDVKSVFAVLRRLNAEIAGEDYAMLLLEHQNGAIGTWDANRFNETNADDPRFTFGYFIIEGNGGTIRLYDDSKITIQRIGEPETEHPYTREKKNFGGDCVFATQQHFVDCLLHDKSFSTDIDYYLENLNIEEAVYASAEQRTPIHLDNFTPLPDAVHAVL